MAERLLGRTGNTLKYRHLRTAGLLGRFALIKSRIGLRDYRYNMGVKITTASPEAEDIDHIINNPKARELIINDGSKTYVVHSTTPEKAATVMQEGLTVPSRGYRRDPEAPFLAYTGLMLAAKNEPSAVRRNILSLAYRYGDPYGDHTGGGGAKLVFEFNQPNPGTSRQRDPYAETFLAQVDGVNIVENPTPKRDNNLDSYLIPGARAIGYFDLNNGGEFVPNPAFQGEQHHDPNLHSVIVIG